MQKRAITRAAALFALLAVVLALCADGRDDYKDYRGQWVVLKKHHSVTAFSVVSQPEIVFCGALGQEPKMDGVVFRLEYKGGAIKESEFVYHGMARYKPSLAWCNPPYYAYGMFIPDYAWMDTGYDPKLPLGKSKLEIRFDNAKAVHTWEGDGIVDSTMPLTYVAIYNQTVEEYLQENPPAELKAGQPARTNYTANFTGAERDWEIFSFTAEEDGAYALHLDVEGSIWPDLARSYFIWMLEGENELNQVQGVDFELQLRRGERAVLLYDHPSLFQRCEFIEFTITPIK